MRTKYTRGLLFFRGNVAIPALLLFLLAISSSGCGEEPVLHAATDRSAERVFTEVARASGITHKHHKPILDHKLDNIDSWVSSVGAAAAAGDYNNDGLIDLYVTTSRKGEPNFLYQNNGDGTFTDCAAEAGLADVNGENGTSMDAVWGDYDSDGHLDLYLVRWGTDALFRNNGDGTFTDVSADLFRRRDGAPGIDWANGNAALFLDFNLDGLLDLYVGNYFKEVDLWHLEDTRIMHDDFETARNGGSNFLYRQEPDGTFTEIAGTLGIDDPGWTLAVGSADVNNDGWPDLYCADDFGPDQLFLGRPGGSFDNVTESALRYDTKKGMNIDFGDFNNDGWLDAYVTNITTAEYLQEGNMLWHNNGYDAEGVFSMTDISFEAGAYDGGWGWGGKYLDYDNDGDLDIVAVNGFISAGEGSYWYDLASWTVQDDNPTDAQNWPTIGDLSFSGYERTRLFRNDDLYSFSEVARTAGIDGDRDGRGVVLFDYDNDGDLDLFIANQDQAPYLYRNDSDNGHHWLGVSVIADTGTGTNPDAIGTRVTIVTTDGQQIRERDGGNGYSGQSDPRLHFGLGANPHIELLEVRWPDGGLQYIENPPVDGYLTVRQDPGAYASRIAIEIENPDALSYEQESSSPPPLPIAPGELERLLSDHEGRLQGLPPGHTLHGSYRKLSATYNQSDRAIAFYARLVEEHPDEANLRTEYALTFIDKMPSCGGIAAIVCKGTLARKSLDQLDRVLEDYPDLWSGVYSRAMNHLHWPRALRHNDDAVADFNRLIDLQTREGIGNEQSYFVRAYIGLGDAYTKAKDFVMARQAWQRGLDLFPGHPDLERRLSILGDDAMLDFVESQRSLDQIIDTDLSFLDHASLPQ
ncbi:MAG: FG-GAP-like repeat-containing protein [Rhodothermales bacterium]